MPKPPKKKRYRVAAEILEGLTDLHHALRDGAVLGQKFTVHTVELVLQPDPMSADSIKSLRHRLNASQAVFAAVLGVSLDSVQAWEQGRRTPTDSALRMMHMFRDDPALFLKQIQLKPHDRAA